MCLGSVAVPIQFQGAGAGAGAGSLNKHSLSTFMEGCWWVWIGWMFGLKATILEKLTQSQYTRVDNDENIPCDLLVSMLKNSIHSYWWC
jgi:hypothetical protein